MTPKNSTLSSVRILPSRGPMKLLMLSRPHVTLILLSQPTSLLLQKPLLIRLDIVFAAVRAQNAVALVTSSNLRIS
jgi:hypothetical protein